MAEQTTPAAGQKSAMRAVVLGPPPPAPPKMQSPRRSDESSEADDEGAPSLAGTKYDRYSRIALERSEYYMDQHAKEEEKRRSMANGEEPQAARPSTRWGKAVRRIGFAMPKVSLNFGPRMTAGMRGQAQTVEEKLKDPDFIKGVVKMMNDRNTCEVFSRFDSDGSGQISAEELGDLLALLEPGMSAKHDIERMMAQLDMNKDGVVDLWEFCVHMRLERERMSAEDAAYEVDLAFQLFCVDEQGRVSAEELRRWFTLQSTGSGLSEDEFREMLTDLGIREGGSIALTALRAHPSFSAKLR